MNSPKVSVCMPNYNYGRFIGEAIQSVLDQTFTDFELIVIDDASTDDSISIIEQFSDNRIKLYRNGRNIGRRKNINKCLSLCSGDYVSILPSDGIYSPLSIEKKVNILDSYPKIGLVYSAVTYVDENSITIGEHRPFDQKYIKSGENEFRRLIFRNYIYTIAAMVRRECYMTLGLFNPEIARARDWEMWLRITLNNYDVAFITKPLAYERIHSANETARLNPIDIGMSVYQIIKTVFRNLPPDKKRFSYLESEALKAMASGILNQTGDNLIKGRVHLARRNIGLAVAIDDSLLKQRRTYFLFVATLFGKKVRVLQKLPIFIQQTIYRIFGQKKSISEIKKALDKKHL